MKIVDDNTTASGTRSAEKIFSDSFKQEAPVVDNRISLGFSPSASGSGYRNIPEAVGGEVVAKLVVMMKEHIGSGKYIDNGHKAGIVLLDKNILTNLEYSNIAIYYVVGNTAKYFNIIVKGTSIREDVTPFELLEVYKRKLQPTNGYYFSNPDTGLDDDKMLFTSDFFDVVVHNYISDAIKTETGNNNLKVGSVNGAVLNPVEDDELKDVAIKVTALAFNMVSIEAKKSAKLINDLNVVRDIQAQNNADANNSAKLVTYVNDTVTHNGAPHIDKTKQPVRSEWTAKLMVNLKGKHKARTHQVNAVTDIPIATTRGYILPQLDYQVNNTQTYYGMGGNVSRDFRVIPNVVITEIDPTFRSQGYALAGILAAVPMMKPEAYIKSMLSRKTNKYLNILTNIFKDPNIVTHPTEQVVGEPLKLEDLSYIDGFNQVDAMLYKHWDDQTKAFVTPVIVSLDVEEMGVSTNMLQEFADIFSTDANVRALADTRIRNAFSELTDGTAYAGEIASGFVTVPLGTWISSEGVERDIREVDLASVLGLSNTDSIHMLQAISERPSNVGAQEFFNKIEVLANVLDPDRVKITGRAKRVILHPDFLRALQVALLNKGVIVNDNTQMMNSNDSFQSIQGVFAGYAATPYTGLFANNNTPNMGVGGFYGGFTRYY